MTCQFQKTSLTFSPAFLASTLFWSAFSWFCSSSLRRIPADRSAMDAIVGDQLDIDRGLPLTDLHGDPLPLVDAPSWDALTQSPDHAGRAGTQIVHAGDLTGRDAGDLGDHRVGDRRLALLGDQGTGRVRH